MFILIVKIQPKRIKLQFCLLIRVCSLTRFGKKYHPACLLESARLRNFLKIPPCSLIRGCSLIKQVTVVTVKSTVDISQNFVAFSEYMHFTMQYTSMIRYEYTLAEYSLLIPICVLTTYAKPKHTLRINRKREKKNLLRCVSTSDLIAWQCKTLYTGLIISRWRVFFCFF